MTVSRNLAIDKATLNRIHHDEPQNKFFVDLIQAFQASSISHYVLLGLFIYCLEKISAQENSTTWLSVRAPFLFQRISLRIILEKKVENFFLSIWIITKNSFL